MEFKIYIRIDGVESLWNLNQSGTDPIKENSMVSFRIETIGHFKSEPLIYLEDYQLELTRVSPFEFKTTESHIFRESFGYAVICIYLDDKQIKMPFNVLAKKINSLQIESMINYLRQVNEKIVNICFSRTSLFVGVNSDFYADPETILYNGEQLISLFTDMRIELHHHLKKRLVPKKMPAWSKGSGSSIIDPEDIFDNLDKLEITTGLGDVLINGRLFSISGVDVTSLYESADVEENRILLGGLFSIKRKIEDLNSKLQIGFNFSTPSFDAEYETITNLLVRVTTDGMKKRCSLLLEKIDKLIRYFKVELKVSYCGEMIPRMTPYTRSSRVYRIVFEKLWLWYKLGTPNFDGLNYIIKLRSISKIYEIFSLFKIVEYLNDNNWLITHAEKHEEFENIVPSLILCEKEHLNISLSYEPKILPYNSETKNFDLVDMVHSFKATEYSNWKPDFVLKISSNTDVYYAILDAKYSYLESVRKYALPNLFEKYYLGMAVFDTKFNVLNPSKILAIYAIFPGDGLSISHWKKDRFSNSNVVRTPMVNGVTLSASKNTELYRMLDQVVNLAMKYLESGVSKSEAKRVTSYALA